MNATRSRAGRREVARGLDRGREVGAGAALLVHDAHLQRRMRQAQHLLDAAKNLAGEGDLLRAVHLRLDDIDRARPAVPARLQVVHRNCRGDGGVQHALGDLLALGVQHGVGEHVVSDIADQHQATARQAQRAAAGCREGPVRIERAFQGLAALFEAGGQAAIH
jgi:hypothetical protein